MLEIKNNIEPNSTFLLLTLHDQTAICIYKYIPISNRAP